MFITRMPSTARPRKTSSDAIRSGSGIAVSAGVSAGKTSVGSERSLPVPEAALGDGSSGKASSGAELSSTTTHLPVRGGFAPSVSHCSGGRLHDPLFAGFVAGKLGGEPAFTQNQDTIAKNEQ